MIRSERSENMPKKKVNPRRIPMAKKELDTYAIIDETMKEDMAHAWLLVAAALVEQELIKPDEIGDLAGAVNRYIEKGTHALQGLGQHDYFTAFATPFQTSLLQRSTVG